MFSQAGKALVVMLGIKYGSGGQGKGHIVEGLGSKG